MEKTTMAMSQRTQSNVGEETVVETFSADNIDRQVEITVDNNATSFSLQNAYFFAEASAIAYNTEAEVKLFLEANGFWGSGVTADENFEWFEADDAVASKTAFDAIHDTEGFVAANDDVIIVVFRGSKGGRDWLTNLSILPRDVPKSWNVKTADGDLHRGFDDGVNTVWLPGAGHPEGMRAVIQKFHIKDGKKRKLYVAGHSLGGALATIAAARLVFEDNMNVAGIYTIGAPRVFDEEMADIFDANMNYGTPMKDKCFRCRNNNDIVSRVPPSPYKHVGTETCFDRFGTVSTTSLADRLLGRFSSLLRFTVIDGVNDHSRVEYCRLLKQAIVDSRLSLVDKAKSVVVNAVQKVVPINKEEMEAEQEAIEAAKQAALEASTSDEEIIPENVPEHLVQEEDT